MYVRPYFTHSVSLHRGPRRKIKETDNRDKHAERGTGKRVTSIPRMAACYHMEASQRERRRRKAGILLTVAGALERISKGVGVHGWEGSESLADEGGKSRILCQGCTCLTVVPHTSPSLPRVGIKLAHTLQKVRLEIRSGVTMPI